MPMHTLRKAVLTFVLGLVLVVATTGEALVARPEEIQLSPEDRQQVARIEEYLNRLTTVRARFLQVSSNGQVAEGDFFLWRPGRIRVEYDPPVPVLIVANGSFLVYYDRELEQVSHLPLGSTAAGVLTKENLSLEDPDLTVTGFERSGGALKITFVQTQDPLEGSITLVFSEDPIKLQKWKVVDAQGVTVEVSLVATRFDVPLNPKLFEFRDPRFFRDQ